MRLILASGSERRNHLLSWLKIPFQVVVSEFDESSIQESEPDRLVKQLAIEKAKRVIRQLKANSYKLKAMLVIGADTVVAIDKEVIGKPEDEEDAVRILKKLSGRNHSVFTGVAVVDAESGKSVVDFEKTQVTFRKLYDKEIRDYVATGEPMDKGGAYAIQMGAAGFVKNIKGSYTNVVGLPLLLLSDLLARQEYNVDKNVEEIIYMRTGYDS
jgi:septum formation protein